MNFDLLFAIIFYGLILIFFLRNREKFKVQGKIFFLYPTHLGIRLMDKVAKTIPRFLKFMGYFGIIVGFLGMGLIFYVLLKGTFQLFFVPEAPPAIAPVLPGINIPGAPALSFFHWIIAIFVVAAFHEFSHGVMARVHNLKVKSSGFAFLGPILAAFVEPDEKKLEGIKKSGQLSIFAAGPFSNVILGILFFLLFSFVSGPFEASMILPEGVVINQVLDGYPAQKAGLEAPFIIQKINGIETLSISDFSKVTAGIEPGRIVVLTTDKGDFQIVTDVNPENESRGFIGVSGFGQKTKIRDDIKLKSYGEEVYNALHWLNLLIVWLFIINIGIGLFNLLPLGPVDGGRMFFVAMLSIFKDKKKAQKVWNFVSMFCLLLIVINMLPWLSKLVLFLIKPFIYLFSLLL